MPADDHPKTRSKSKQAVDAVAATLTTDPNLVTGEASNKTNSPTNTTTTDTAAAKAAATDGDNSSTSPG